MIVFPGLQPFAPLIIGGAAAADAYVETGDLGYALKACVIAGFATHITQSIGGHFDEALGKAPGAEKWLIRLEQAVAHGVVGGFSTGLQGGSFGAGVASSSLASFAGGASVSANQPEPVTILIAALVGGTAAEIGGGKFGNGAISGAMLVVLNHLGEKISDVRNQHGWCEFAWDPDTGERFESNPFYGMDQKADYFYSRPAVRLNWKDDSDAEFAPAVSVIPLGISLKGISWLGRSAKSW